MTRDEFIERLRDIAARLASAPAVTEEAARANLARRRAQNPADTIGYYPHQAGGLEQTCTSAAGDIEALIRRLDREGIASGRRRAA